LTSASPITPHHHTAQDSRPLIALFTANAISLTGNIFSAIAIPWLVLQTTGSATQTGITGFFTILPIVLTGFFGGALIDRIGYKRTSILADLASGITVLVIPLLYLTIGLPFWPLMILVFFGALFDAPGSTARDALLPDLAAKAGMLIERATSISHVVERGSRLVGAPLAGLLISIIGTVNVLWVDAASFFVSAVIVGGLIAGRQTAWAKVKSGNYFEEIKVGLQFIARDQLILTIIIVIMLTNALDSAFSGVVQPVYVKEIFGNVFNLGLLIAANGGGAVVGGLIFAAIGHRVSRHYAFIFAFILTSFRFWAYYFQPPIGILLIAVFICSIGAGPLNPILGAVQFERIPQDMRGRVFGAITAGALIAMPFGMLLGGILTEKLGVLTMLIGLGIIYLLTTASMIFIPAMREMDRKKIVDMNPTVG
jgi:MFS family permease